MPTWKIKQGTSEEYLYELIDYLSPQEYQIVNTLDIISHEFNRAPSKTSDTQRTCMILDGMDKLGVNLGYEVKSSLCSQEWLFDEVWFIKKRTSWNPIQGLEETSWNSFEGLKLTCECEWNGNPNKILEDFAKLTIANSEISVFVHSDIYYKGDRHVTELCKSIIDYSFHKRYLFFGFQKENPEIRIDFIGT